MIIDTYKTIAASSMGEFKDKGSKFIAYTTPLLPHSVRSDNLEGDFSLFLEKIKKEHPKARHHCYAWRMGIDGNSYRTNDDGEPSGTAGRPILGQIVPVDIRRENGAHRDLAKLPGIWKFQGAIKALPSVRFPPVKVEPPLSCAVSVHV